MASIGLPGFSGFIAEFQVLIGVWRSLPWMTLVAGFGILVGVAFAWRALTKAFFGDGPTPAPRNIHCRPSPCRNASARFCSWPQPSLSGSIRSILTDLILPTLNSPLFEGLRTGSVAMNGVNYFELLRLTLPEIVVALAALLTLTLDILLLHARIGTRFGFTPACSSAAPVVLAAIFVAHGSPAVRLADGMLALTPLTTVVQIVAARSDDSHSVALRLDPLHGPRRRVPRTDPLRYRRHDVPRQHAKSAADLCGARVPQPVAVHPHRIRQATAAQSAEAALKYFLFGGMSAGFLLFGISLLYGLSNSHRSAAKWPRPSAARRSIQMLLIAIVMVTIGFGFKVAAAPFHFWAPDAYQGAPSTSAGFIASSSKVASFFVFAQVVTVGLASAAGIRELARLTAGMGARADDPLGPLDGPGQSRGHRADQLPPPARLLGRRPRRIHAARAHRPHAAKPERPALLRHHLCPGLARRLWRLQRTGRRRR